MSGVNITCNVGNQLGNGGGEMKFEVAPKETAAGLATCIATEIVNEILENALNIATMGSVSGLHCDTIAFSVDDGVCAFTNNNFNQNTDFKDNIEDLNDECPDIKDIIDGLSAIHIPKHNAEEPLRLDVEMKRLLNEMMSPPYDIVNYEALARKDGVGDQPIEDFIVRENDEVNQDDDCLVDVEKTKLVEKKTRVTDLVMNSKQVLSEYLMSDESRKQQEEWEEKNEQVIQIIELDDDEDKEEENLTKQHDANVLNKEEEEEEKEDVVRPVENEHMDNVDLNATKTEVEIVNEKQDGGGENFDGDSRAEKSATPGSSTSKNNTLDSTIAKDICKRKFENFKKKKWNINLKLWGFGKKKSRDKEVERKDMHVHK